MNTTIAIISIIVITNWTRTGEFKDTAGRRFDVQEGKLQTNTVVDVPWIDTTKEYHIGENGYYSNINRFTLKSVEGPIVSERRIEISNVYVTNIQWFYDGKKIDPKQIPYPPIYTFTNRAAEQTNLFLWNRGKKTYAIPAIKLED